MPDIPPGVYKKILVLNGDRIVGRDGNPTDYPMASGGHEDRGVRKHGEDGGEPVGKDEAGVGTNVWCVACQIREAGGLGSPNKSGVVTTAFDALLSGRRCRVPCVCSAVL